MVLEMLLKARQNVQTAGVSSVKFLSGSADDLPLAGGSVDVIITNGVFNLCLDKLKVISEMVRVLHAGSRLHMADILLEEHVTPAALSSKGTWSD